MENFSTYPSSYQLDELTSLAWRPCWGLSPQILSCLTTPLEKQPETLPGGSTSSITPKSLGTSLVLASLQTETHSQMPVWASGLALSLLEDGALGASSRDGKEKGEILDGQKLLASSFLSALSSQSAHLENVSKYLGIIEGWSKAGGKEEVETRKQVTSSGEFMTSCYNFLLIHVEHTFSFLLGDNLTLAATCADGSSFIFTLLLT